MEFEEEQSLFLRNKNFKYLWQHLFSIILALYKKKCKVIATYWFVEGSIPVAAPFFNYYWSVRLLVREGSIL